MNFDLENHRPLREIVYEELKRRIMTGKITPHTRMMEVDLAEDMGVSRTPVREAIRKLEKEGLVTIEPRKGAYASDISTEDMVNVLTVREELEALAAGIAASRITGEQISRMEHLTDLYAQAIEANDTAAIIDYDEQFHQAIVSVTDNRTLIQFVSNLQELVLRFRYLYYEDFSRYRNMPEEHHHIIDALKSGDEKRASEVVREHIHSLKSFVSGIGTNA
ncbi:MAG: GntR family transcriptional regulator [Eubacterium sp.]|nr:GntR family transcriptional regulator [Eubacterium sp.]